MKRLSKRSAHFAVSLTAIIGMAAAASAQQQQVDIIPFDATWDYLFTALDDGTGTYLPADPFTANNVDFTQWTSVGFSTTTLTFDDGRSASWQSGPALFGQGDAGVVYGTEFPTPAANNRNITQYFRHEFTSSQEFNNLTMSLIVDDGAVVYLDGSPVSSMMSCCSNTANVDYDVANPSDPRFGQFPGYRDRSTVTNGPPPGSAEGTIYTEAVASIDILSPGPHVVSVETHQASTNSSDSRFNFRFFQNVDNEWQGDAANNNGSFSAEWLNDAHWAAGTTPNGAGATAPLLQTPTRNTTLYSNSNVTLGRLEFDNSNTYAIAGHGTFTFATSDGSNAAVDVVQGEHEIQAKVALSNSLDISTAAGSIFRINNGVAGNGNSINVSGDGETRLNGALIDVTVNAAAAALGGSGSIGGDLNNMSSIVSPGNDVGVLTVLGNYTQGSAGILAIELAGTGDYDLLDIAGSAEFGGALEVSLVGDFQPSFGDEFDILNFSSAAGAFGSTSLPALAEGLQWDMSNLYAAGSLAVVPEPAGILLLLCGGFAIGLIRRLDKKMKRVSHFVALLALLPALGAISGGSLHAGSPTPDSNVIPFGSSWRHLFPLNLNQDPLTGDGFFDDDWFMPNYAEPDLDTADGVTISWQGPDPSPIGYGVINAFTPLGGFATEILPAPPDGERYTAYLRQRFTTPAGIPQNGPFVIEFAGDDGFVFYLDGEVLDVDPDPDQARYNCCQDTGGQPVPQDLPPGFLDRSLATGPENVFLKRTIQDLTLTSGSHLLAISLHNQNNTSSDIGLELRMYVPGNGRPWIGASGDWADAANWEFGIPSSSQQFAVFGDAITVPQTVLNDAARSLDGVQFENDVSYNIAGTGSINLQGSGRNASLNVLSGDGSTAGDHEFQVRVNLNNNTDALVEAGSSITFNNLLNLNSRTLNKTGSGDLLVRNNENAGDGTINVTEGALGGGGTVAGNVNVSGGNLAPSGIVNPSPFSNKLTVSGNASVTSGGATLAVFGNGDSDAISGGGSGTITFGAGATIDILAADGYTPANGDTAQVLADWTAINGSGVTVIAPGWNTDNLFVDGTIVFGSVPMGDACDFDGNMLCNSADLDMLTAEIASAGGDLSFDINQDGSITIADRDEWLSQAADKNGLSGPYLLGDANLDGAVNASDLNDLGQRWLAADNAWSHGDFNADGAINAGDLNELGQRWLQQVPAAAASSAVPEPSALGLLLLAALGLLVRSRRN